MQHLDYNGPVLLSKTTLGIETFMSLLRMAGMGMDGNLKTMRHFFLRFNDYQNILCSVVSDKTCLISSS